MKLVRISLDRMPGIDRPYVLDTLGSGLNVIIGPNGIGKTRLCTAVRALLWHERGVPDDRLTADAEFVHDGVVWRVSRDGSRHTWQRDGIEALPPQLPGEQLEACFFLGLRDLLDDSDRAGRDLAAEIRRQMAGGFDLARVERDFAQAVSKQTGQREARELQTAESAIRQAERAQTDLERRALEIDALEGEAAEAERASRRRVHVDRAIALEERLREQEHAKAELAALPAELDRLDGREVDRVDRLDARLAEMRAEQESSQRARLTSLEAARASGLVEPIDPVAFESVRDRIEKLAELERELEGARADFGEARAAVDTTRAVLGMPSIEDGSPVDPASAEMPAVDALPLEVDAELFAFLSDSAQLERERSTAEAGLRLLSEHAFSEEDRRRFAASRRGLESLREWLSAPDPTGANAAVWPPRASFVATGLVCVLVGLLGATLALGWASASIALVGLGGGLAVAGLMMRVRRPNGDSIDHRAHAIERFPESVDPPARWDREAVVDRLREIEDLVADLDSKEKRSVYRKVERESLENTLKGLSDRDEALAAWRQSLAARFGLAPRGSDAEWVDFARALDDARGAHRDWERAGARIRELEVFCETQLDAIRSFWSKLGDGIVDGEAASIDATAARAAIRVLADRDRSLRSAHADRVREETNLNRLGREIEGLDGERREIFASAGLAVQERAELVRLVARLDEFRERKRRCAELAHDIARDLAELDAVGEGALASADLADLQAERRRLEERASGRDEIIEKLTEIRASARSAREGHGLEDAIARRDALRRALRERRDEVLAAGAGRFLIESVRREHESNQMPRVLAQARDHFGIFTHHAYELRVSPGENESFVAIDAESGEGLGPAKLSDGTRAQLVLAARLAFAEEAESGADLPLFLDEAMDHSDPERFHAIARSLARMVADEGRQIFYLTNDPTDVERFQQAFAAESCDPPAVLDLARIRGRSASVESAGALRVEPLPTVPAPVDEDAGRYGAELGVPVFDPALESGGQHLYYVLRDDLKLLHAFLEARIESVGQCRQHLDRGTDFARAIARDFETAASLTARIELLETFCLAWREGRGRPVDRMVLESSGVVSDRYLDALADVVAEGSGAAEVLVQALEERSDPRVKGFQRRSAEKLEQFLIEEGHLDDRPILSGSQLVERAVATPAANRLGPKRAAELIHQWHSLANHSKSEGSAGPPSATPATGPSEPEGAADAESPPD